ncbi:DNA translocase FtsK [Fredinandcohnia onubensis]|uniref:DNA translocase FtsK n=1 Tax=Fredinandcohnia onubensis TaxID=1571209 RepID=UPI000C0C04BE|nr:DNA translocase FtsK [Fredinandcohnia onubensis]
MNWIKRLLHFLQTDDDDPIEIKTTQIRQNKPVEARVTYEYPKGNFRFPVIPDQDKTRMKKEKVQTKQTQRTQQTQRAQQKPKTQQAQKVQQTQQTRTSQPTRNSTPKTVVKLQEKQPFQPSETPSPVFGLGKPKPQEIAQETAQGIVEYELPSTPIADTESIARAWKEAQEEVASTIILTEQVEPKQYTVSTTLEDTEQKVANFANQLLREEEVTEEIPAAIEPQSEESIKEETPIQVVVEEELNASEETNLVEQEMMIHTEEIVTEEPVDQIENIEVQEDLKAEATETSIENTETQVEQIEKSEHTRTEPRRSNIPFNVLMFKKDKQKLSQRQPEKVTQVTPVEPIEQKRQQEVPIQNEQPVEQEQTRQSEQPVEQEQTMQQELQTHQEDEVQQSGYTFPGLSFLNAPPAEQADDSQWLLDQQNILDQTLRNFKVRAKVVNVTQGPAVTRFEVHPEPGVKVNKITNLSDDIKLSLAAKDIRIEAPIPGKNTIGIEVPNRKSKPVLLKEIIQSPEFETNQSPLAVAMGLDISGKPIVTDLQKMPHGLIAGATGSGKSVCINAMLVSLLYKASPDEVKLLLIDPKMVELAPYNHIPHLVSPVITDVKAATASLKWAVEEMERRYELFAHTGVRDIGRYNEMVKKHDEKSGKLPYLVIIIDELADLMMVAPGDVEDSICRIAQKARACGIHLILATQRPSVDVITGLIKANIPTRIAFSVSSQVDSRTIIDSSGAEKLLGRGDMLFLENGSSKPFRVQGNFVTDDEIEEVVNFVKSEMKPSYMFEQDELLKKASITNEEDELFFEACEFVLEHGGASTSSVQRRFRIGYNRAARLIDMMEEQGIISESRGSKPREVLITEEDLAELYEG